MSVIGKGRMSDVGKGLRSEVGGKGLMSEVGGRWSERGGGQMKRDTEQIKSAKDLRVYKKAYELAMEIYQVSKEWPAEEKYALTDQIRRSSRSVCANLREAWAKRRYQAHFVSKLTDADGENSETDTWLDFALDCGYISESHHLHLFEACKGVGGMLGAMLTNPQPFIVRN